MEQYIKKATVVAEIEKRIDRDNEMAASYSNNSEHDYLCRVKEKVYKSLLSFLDTLEVKEVDLENSIVCKVGWYDGILLGYTQEQQDELLEKIGANVGDKVRVILIKE